MVAESKTNIVKEEIQGDNISDTKMPTTVAEFETWLREQTHLADKRFEFLDGAIVEKTSMKPEEFFIFKFLSRLFAHTSAYKAGDELISEGDSHISDTRKRIPDITYVTAAQIKQARTTKRATTTFAIEILSPNEALNDIEEKIQDYFNSGTQVVWYISPEQQHIYRYTSPTKVDILKGDAICSAEPVLDDFSFPVKDMFL